MTLFVPERTPKQETLGPLLSKSLRNMIRHKFITEYGYRDSVPLAEYITDDLVALIERVMLDSSAIKPGQLLWLAVEREHRHPVTKWRGEASFQAASLLLRYVTEKLNQKPSPSLKTN